MSKKEKVFAIALTPRLFLIPLMLLKSNQHIYYSALAVPLFPFSEISAAQLGTGLSVLNVLKVQSLLTLTLFAAQLVGEQMYEHG